MALSPWTEEAFNNAIECAYGVQECIEIFGRNSEETEFAELMYCYWMKQYYARRQHDDRKAWWDEQCLANPHHPGCKDYEV